MSKVMGRSCLRSSASGSAAVVVIGDGSGQAKHREIAAGLQAAVKELPGGQAVLRARLEQVDRQVAQRLGRLDQERARGHAP